MSSCANRKKCLFERRSIEYLGHIISEDGVAADGSKVPAMTQWPQLKTLKELRGFLGLIGYYRRFIYGYGEKVWPMVQLLKKEAFLWNESAQGSFEAMKKIVSNVPVLAMPNFSKQFVLERMLLSLA